MEINQEIYDIFNQEFEELLRRLEREISNASTNKPVQVEEIFRVFHTLKGNAATLELKRLQQLTTAYCEFYRPKQKETKLAEKDLVKLRACFKSLNKFLNATKHGKKGRRIKIANLINRL